MNGKTSSASEKRRRFAVEKCTLRTAEVRDLRRSGGVAERLSLSGGGEVKARLAEAAGRAVEGDHRRVIDEPVDEGGGDLVGEQEVVALEVARRLSPEGELEVCKPEVAGSNK